MRSLSVCVLALTTTLAFTTLTFVSPDAAEGQQFPSFGGLEARVGVASAEGADPGVAYGAEVDFGYVASPVVRVILGVEGFGADIDRSGATGDLTATGAVAALRTDLLPHSRLSVFATGGITWHNVTANVPQDPDLERLLDGSITGLTAGGGLAWRLTNDGRISATLNARHTWANNLDHANVGLGLRYLIRGSRSYVRPADVGDWRTRSDERAAAEAERREAEARRDADEVRRAAETEAAAERREAERRETEAETQQRAEAEAAEAERQRVLERAEAAEEEAEAARTEAAAARTEAEEARLQAEQAEARMLESLESLRRVLTTLAGVRETERGIVVTLGQGLFGSGEWELGTRSRQEVGRIAAVVAEHPGQRVRVEGHTDSVGGEDTNQALSERRANSVMARLIAEGLDPERITAVGYGETRPIASNDTADGREENRRVEIIIEQP